ncbi:hypothetical protein BHE74_00041583, partial [Ensete ventricosum]
AISNQQLSTRLYLQHPHRAPQEGLHGEGKNDMAHNDLAATSSLPRTTSPPTWPTRCGKLVGRRYGGASGRAADLAQVRPNPQRSYDLPDTGKADTLTCGRMPHRKDDGRSGGVRWHGKPQGQPGCQPIPVTGYEGSINLAEHRPRPELIAGELAHKGLNQQDDCEHDDFIYELFDFQVVRDLRLLDGRVPW